MQGGEKLSLEKMQAFLESSEEVEFEGKSRGENYRFVDRVLREQDYVKAKRANKGVIKRYLSKVTGLCRAQITRLIRIYVEGEAVEPKPYRRRRFPARYTRADVELLAQTDEAHEILNGAATRRILHREYHEFKNGKYERLANISVAHLYRLRRTATYRNRLAAFHPTRPTPVAIGERRRPEPQGRPGYIRIDTVHQGDFEGRKGLYHINAVDEVTQWEVVGAAAQITEACLLPLLRAMLDQFPFRILGFHSDNGSEYINYSVQKLLNGLLIEQTKSRPRHSNDNGLVESKNGAVVRKHIGFGHIAPSHAAAFDKFYREHLNPYLNFHRPCAVPEMRILANGKTKRIYRRYETPFELLRQIPDVEQYLRPDQTLPRLKQHATRTSDTEAARQMREAKRKIFTDSATKTA